MVIDLKKDKPIKETEYYAVVLRNVNGVPWNYVVVNKENGLVEAEAFVYASALHLMVKFSETVEQMHTQLSGLIRPNNAAVVPIKPH